MSPPRLTGALRSFSTVSKQDNLTQDIYDLKLFRHYLHKQCLNYGLTWQKIVQFFTQHLEKKDQPVATLELRNILQAAKQIGYNCILYKRILYILYVQK
uniref:Uncharacterized protein n=1 Tax=Sinocyclocheilus rhinocerous TaxID=307959 RepID=A0A673JDG9_9TELE